MKLTGLLYKPVMAAAIMDGLKGMTRRPINPKTPEAITLLIMLNAGCKVSESKEELIRCHCPYGQVGDILYVREPYYALGHWVKDGKTKSGNDKWNFIDLTLKLNRKYLYALKSDMPVEVANERIIAPYRGWHKRNSLFMPLVAARTFLKITGVKVERLWDISEEDARAEGVERCTATQEKFGSRAAGLLLFRDYARSDNSLVDIPCNGYDNAVDSFNSLWVDINGKESYDKNPWVFAVSFEKCDRPLSLL